MLFVIQPDYIVAHQRHTHSHILWVNSWNIPTRNQRQRMRCSANSFTVQLAKSGLFTIRRAQKFLKCFCFWIQSKKRTRRQQMYGMITERTEFISFFFSVLFFPASIVLWFWIGLWIKWNANTDWMPCIEKDDTHFLYSPNQRMNEWIKWNKFSSGIKHSCRCSAHISIFIEFPSVCYFFPSLFFMKQSEKNFSNHRIASLVISTFIIQCTE